MIFCWFVSAGIVSSMLLLLLLLSMPCEICNGVAGGGGKGAAAWVTPVFHFLTLGGEWHPFFVPSLNVSNTFDIPTERTPLGVAYAMASIKGGGRETGGW